MRQSKRRFNQGLALGCLMASVGMLMHSSVDFVLQDFAIVIVYITILCIPFLLDSVHKKK
jgi:hypothetical protein